MSAIPPNNHICFLMLDGVSLTEYLAGADLSEHSETVSKRGKRTTTVYRRLSAMRCAPPKRPLRGELLSVEIRNHTGKRLGC